LHGDNAKTKYLGVGYPCSMELMWRVGCPCRMVVMQRGKMKFKLSYRMEVIAVYGKIIVCSEFHTKS
jgi:hypothetical protein